MIVFDFLSFSAVESALIDWLPVIALPVALAIGIGIALWVIDAAIGIVRGGQGSTAGSGVSAGGSAGGSPGQMRTGRIPRARAPREESQQSRDEWAMLEERARRVNGWDGRYD